MENDAALQTRREFFLRSVQAALLASSAGALVAFLESCNSPNGPNSGGNAPGLQTINATATNGVISLTIDSSSPIASVGTAALVQYQGGPLLVAHTSQNTFVALTAICTHMGCTVNGYSSGTYTCPCHGSQYDVNGNVTRGPAPRALTKFPTAFANNVLTITV